MPFDTIRPYDSFVKGQQNAMQREYAGSRNALAQMEVEQAPRDIANRNALAERQQQQYSQEQVQRALQQTAAGAMRIAQSENPQAEAAQAYPDFAAKLREQNPDWDRLSPDEAREYVGWIAGQAQSKLGIAPAPKVKTIGDTADPGAGILQEDPTTGVLKQVVAPQKPDNFATGQANADRRAQEQRDFTAEQNKLNRDAKLKPTTPSPEAAAQKLDSAMNTLSAIKDVKDKIGLMTAGPGGQLMRAFAGTDASDMEANIDTIKANIGFDRLQMMRDASKTGGALGGIAVQELNLLQSTIASLHPKQSPSQLRRNLEKVEAQYTKSVEAYSRALGGGQSAPQQAQAPQQAIEYLKANPQFRGAFRQKYGYLPSDL